MKTNLERGVRVCDVAQTFLSAGSGDFPVASSRTETRDWKVPWTRRLESLRYVADGHSPAQPPVPALPAVGLGGAEVGAVGAAEVHLDQKADAAGAL